MPRGVARARAPAPAPRKVSHRASAARQAGIRLNADEQQELVSHYLLEDGGAGAAGARGEVGGGGGK